MWIAAVADARLLHHAVQLHHSYRTCACDMPPNVGLGTDGPVQRGWGLWLTSVLAVIIAGVFVAARIAQRYIKRSGLGLDDWMIIAALVSSVLLSVTECQGGLYRGSGALLLADEESCCLWIR